jgi:hypothetical protein
MGLVQAAPRTHAPVLSHVSGVFPLQPAVPGMQARQLPFKHTGLEAAHGAQLAPQWVASVFVSYAHAVDPPHALYPGLHLAPQAPPVQVAAPLAGGGHEVQLPPQWVGSSWVE